MVRFRTITSTFQPSQKGASKKLPFTQPPTVPILTNTPTTPGTPVLDEPSTRTPPKLNQATARLAKHAQVENMDSFLRNKNLTTHPDLANYVYLCSDSDSDHELNEPARKYPCHSLSAETTQSKTPSTLPTDSPCPLAAALMEPTPTTSTRQPVVYPTPSTSTTRERVPSRWDTPLLNPSPNFVEASSYRINTSRQPTGPSQHSSNTPPVINMENGLPPLPPRTALNLLTDYQSSSSAEPTPEKFPSDT